MDDAANPECRILTHTTGAAPQITLSIFDNVMAPTCRTRTAPFPQFAAEICFNPPAAATKEAQQLLSPVTFGDKLSAKGSLRHAANIVAVHGVVCDYDGVGNVSVQTIIQKLRRANILCVVHTTATHTADKARCRIIAPLSVSITGSPEQIKAAHNLYVARINNTLDGVLARESFNVSQSFYFGRVLGTEYIAELIAGHPIDLLHHLQEVGAPQPTEPVEPARGWTVEPQPPARPPATNEEIIERIKVSKPTAHFQGKATGGQLWNGDFTGYQSSSEARLTLMWLILFFTGGNCQRALEIFKLSGLMSEKLEGRDELLRKEIMKVWQGYTGSFYGAEKAGSDDEKIIAELAALPRLEFERVRKEKADELGVRVTVLSHMVAKERARLETENEEVEFLTDPDPWPEPVALAVLLDDIRTILRRHLALPKHADIAITLWVLMTYVTDVISTLPILALRSPEPRCGKTTCIELLSKIVSRALPTSNLTPATMFRAIDLWEPLTLMIDEGDAFLRENEELRGIINSGHTRAAAYVLRSVGDDHTPTRFSTWCAKVIALIGELSGTLSDRSVTVLLRRKRRGENVERLRDADPRVFSEIQSRCRRWADDNREHVRRARPAIPAELHDRAADNWDPLFAIADAASPEWGTRARAAAAAASSEEDDTESQGISLLTDLRDFFEQERRGRVPTRTIIDHLYSLGERPWLDYRRGKPINANQLGALLRQFGVKSVQFRDGGHVIRGYCATDFADAFERYLDPPTPNSAATPLQTNSDAGCSDNAAATQSAVVAAENGLEPAPLSQCSGVAAESPPNDPKGINWVRAAFLRGGYEHR